MGYVVALYYEFSDYNLGALSKGTAINIDRSIPNKDLIPDFASIA
ncbi:hypothetical protein [Psychrobacter glacincola]|nr:hypothetical protein [Psychrobacter glacincola]